MVTSFYVVSMSTQSVIRSGQTDCRTPHKFRQVRDNVILRIADVINIRTSPSEKVPSHMCAQRRLRSACASAQSDQSLRCPREESLHPWLSKMRTVKILTSLREFAGWSESSLGAPVRRYVLGCCRSFCYSLSFSTIWANSAEVNIIFFFRNLKKKKGWTPLPAPRCVF